MELEVIIKQLKRMGCLCFKPSLDVEGVRYKVLRHIADGGFSSVELVENIRTGKKHAVKRITCHSIEDQNVAKNEIEYNRRFSKHPNIITLVGSVLNGSADIVHNVTSEVILVFPYYEVKYNCALNYFKIDIFRGEHCMTSLKEENLQIHHFLKPPYCPYFTRYVRLSESFIKQILH